MAATVLIVAVAVLNNRLVANSPVSAPSPSVTGTPLADGSTLGASGLAWGDRPGGGQGQPVAGVQCNTSEMSVEHLHAHLSLFVNGKQIAIPGQIGIVSQGATAGCLYWIHTHDASGIIHIESPLTTAPYTLGQFFAIWGEQLTSGNVAGNRSSIHVFVNGQPYDGNPDAIPLTAHQEITLEVGKPLVNPPIYAFPTGE
ncbi:MAG: hypothetical protein ACREM6_02940 [Vulcanimicrobiaceae bacterium]